MQKAHKILAMMMKILFVIDIKIKNKHKIQIIKKLYDEDALTLLSIIEISKLGFSINK